MRKLFCLVPLTGACFTTHSETASLCELVSEDVVARDDTSMGYSAEEVVEGLDGQTWVVTWLDDEPELYAGSSLASLSTGFSIGSGSIVRREQVSSDAGTCPMTGPFLSIPATVSVASPDGSLTASGEMSLAATGVESSSVVFGWERVSITGLPGEFVTVAERNSGATSSDLEHYLTFHGDGGDLRMHIGTWTIDRTTDAAVATAVLNPAAE